MKQLTKVEEEIMRILLHPSIVEDLFKNDLHYSSFHHDFNVKKNKLDAVLLNCKESITLLLENPSLCDENLIRSKLKEFISLILKMVKAPSELAFLVTMFKPIERSFKVTIENNIYSNLKIEEYAKLCNMSTSSFKRKFKKIYTESPREYITKMKLKKASKLLLLNDDRIADIAYDCGFESITTFNRVFKKYHKISPTKYRLNQNE
jgi:AraC-like DNA-binding protein